MLLVRGATGALSTIQKDELACAFPFAGTGHRRGPARFDRRSGGDVRRQDRHDRVSNGRRHSGPIDAGQIAESYFLSLGEGEAFEDTALRAQYLTLQGVVSVVLTR